MSPELSAILSMIVLIISSYLRDDKQAVGINAIFAFVALALLSVFAYWMTAGFTANFHDSVLGVLGFMALIAANEAKDLLAYIKAANSPLAPSEASPHSLAAKRAQSAADTLNAKYNTGPMGNYDDERGA
jgi:ABC-type lipoprotein release transport system permease subunit